MTHVDSNRNLTRLQLIQRSILRGKCRLDRLNEIPNTAPAKGVRAPVYVGDGEFLMNVSIGTPPVPFSGIIDTGSDLIWTQCLPCTKCFKQPTPIFDPSKSSTCANVSCTSDLCKDMNVFECSNGCKYLYTYGDESSTEGFMATDTITFMDSENNPVSIPNIGFGCGVNNQGSGLGQGAGIVGLGRGPVSLVSQLGLGKFSYCLTSLGEKKPSNVLFGSLAVLNYTTSGSTHRRATPLIQNPFQPSFYYVAIEGITIGETLLPISRSVFKLKEDGSGGMIIDSGTTLTYLQEDAFRVVKREFTSQMKLRVSDRTDTTGLDLCFDLPTKHVSEISVPRLKLHFEGVDLELPAENYMISDPSTGLVCLAMAASSGISIFGNIQQQNLLVLHDLEEETVSFLPIQCDEL
ncbi:saccharopepsin [Sarracenia purpurea var. burkii]